MLYFCDGQYLETERRMVVIHENEHLAGYVIESLLNGTQRDELITLIPARTQLLSVSVEYRVCFVNFSAAFADDRPDDADRQRLVLASVIESLTALPDIERVQLLVDGEVLRQYGDIDVMTMPNILAVDG